MVAAVVNGMIWPCAVFLLGIVIGTIPQISGTATEFDWSVSWLLFVAAFVLFTGIIIAAYFEMTSATTRRTTEKRTSNTDYKSERDYSGPESGSADGVTQDMI